ncbi:MAG: 23S rRNA (guanosine(2251)-2'-O)-methyltransferase RlmB [Clostridia bacterium]|nr:23S rRNA (guanosine(2251)-2'-O)-methyltransferase RlmB [Clostridia bacterium]
MDYNNKGRKVRPERQYNAELDENIVFGRNAVRELLSGGRDIEKIFVLSGEREGSITMLVGEARGRNIPIIESERRRLDELSHGGRHQGIVALAAEHNYSSISDMLDYAAERGERPFIVVCDGIEDPHNLGAIIRSAECCGAHGVIIPKRRAVGLTSTVAKASAGALMHMRVAKVTNIASTIDELKEKGLWIYGADMDGGEYYSTDFDGAVALVLGSEGFGISRLVKEKCDFIVSIPLFGRVNSMNVSCAAAVILAEVARQRHTEVRRG